jgi:hypothetical protein
MHRYSFSFLSNLSQSTRKQLKTRAGSFEFFGTDIMMDSEYGVYLTEFNHMTYIELDTPTHARVVPHMLRQFLETGVMFSNQ